MYPPRNSATKKREILDRKVFEFLQSRNLDVKHEKQLKKAELVRSAKLNYLKARLLLANTYASEFETDVELIDKLNKEISLCEGYSYEEIIEFSLKYSR
ncbi:hypothetical protein [uncultured Dokdonia sp.]|uniref:hypothetical protein n=1 Tax=uncultured Dokdonia sp. TaxID=575653 RepID=UPI002629A903|nr:hypothetical protein [uncultured Dokdonia sp.]